MARDAAGGEDSGSVERLASALERAEKAASMLESRHRRLRQAAEETVGIIDRLVPARG